MATKSRSPCAIKLAFVDAGATAPLVFEGQSGAGLRLDTVTHQVWVNGKLLEPPLSAQQYRLLELMTGSAGVVGRDDIVRAVWPDAGRRRRLRAVH